MKLIITRPEPAASRTAEKLQKLGHEAIISPVLKIIDSGVKISHDNYSALLVTSSNALSILEQRGICKQLLKIPLFVVGDATAEKARGLGFSQVFSATGTTAELANLVIHRLKPTNSNKQKVLYICGVDITTGLSDAIQKSGLNISMCAIYKAILVHQLTNFSINCLRENVSVGILLYSARSARQTAKIIARENLIDHIDNTMFYAISEKVKLSLPAKLQRQCSFSKHPDENNLMALIDA